MSSGPPFGFQPSDEDPSANQPPFGGGMDQFGAMLEQLGRMMRASGSGGGSVNWDLATQVAREHAVAEGDPSPSVADSAAVADAVRLAELWLDDRTTFPASPGAGQAWSRSDWVVGTLPAWQTFIEPIAEQTQATLGSMMSGQTPDLDELPPQLREAMPPGMDLGEMAGPLLGMARQMGSAMFAMQAGQGLGSLSREVFGATDIGVPRTEDGRPTLIPANIAAFADGLEIPQDQVRLFLALREAAHQRLFAHVPWLRARLTGAVEEYARGIHVDMDRIAEAASELDPSNPAGLQEIMSSGVFEPQDTPAQEAAKARLETLLALVEGWVSAVVAEAAGTPLPAAVALAEAMRRRRAAGGPAEKTFATLIGLEMRPRRLREAAAFWGAVVADGGPQARDALWAHPDLLPTAEDLAAPNDFLARSGLSLPGELLGAPEQGEAEGSEAEDEGPDNSTGDPSDPSI
jgi:putative hydrolase